LFYSVASSSAAYFIFNLLWSPDWYRFNIIIYLLPELVLFFFFYGIDVISGLVFIQPFFWQSLLIHFSYCLLHLLQDLLPLLFLIALRICCTHVSKLLPATPITAVIRIIKITHVSCVIRQGVLGLPFPW
jgi:hypothetical protein